MLKDSFKVVDYFYLLEIISNYACSSLGKDYCLSLRPISDSKEIKERLDLLAELREFLEVKGWVSEEVVSVSACLHNVDIKGSFLSCDEILLIKRFLQGILNTKRFILSEGREYKRLCKLAKQIPDLRDLLSLLNRVISDSGNIKDSASIRLKKIREKKAYYRTYIQKRLQHVLLAVGINDFSISIRDGRYVVGLNSSKRGNIKGIFHGYSHSKATSFVEPAEIVEENNRLSELEAEEKEEENRILIAVTEQIAEKKEQIEYAHYVFSKIDGTYAQARFCNLISCIKPELCENDKDIIEIYDARNPILAYLSLKDDSDCVPINLFLNKDKNVLIISGPNRGGKTVALKTLGLLCLMTQTGLHIPAREGTRLRIFKKIIAEIGDDQDIRSGMSTFSAHIQHLKDIIEYADKDTLVIIDEPGMGTDPMEGAALSMAILDYLIEKGAFVAISTHLNRLKLYGVNNKKVMNASVEFDFEKRLPTYRLKYGSPGVSMGFEIAKDMKMPESILIRARHYLEDNEFQLNNSIARLNELIAQLNEEKKKFYEIRKKYENMQKNIIEEKEKIIDSARKEAEFLINNARMELRDAIKQFKKKKDISPKQIISKVDSITKELIDKFEPIKNDSADNSNIILKEGQKIYHKGLKKEGVVFSYDPDKKGAFVLLANVKIWADVKDIEVIEENKSQLSEKRDKSISHADERGEVNFMPEINLIGYRVDEAIAVIDKAIDRAILNGSPGFKIIHGIGTGKLRKSLRDYLKTIPQVKNIKNGELQAGGDAVTIVELK